MTVLHHALCGDAFDPTPVSITFRGKCSKFVGGFVSDATQQVGIYFAHIKLLLCCGEADTLLNPHDLATDHSRCHYECYEISKLPGTRYNLRTA